MTLKKEMGKNYFDGLRLFLRNPVNSFAIHGNIPSRTKEKMSSEEKISLGEVICES